MPNMGDYYAYRSTSGGDVGGNFGCSSTFWILVALSILWEIIEALG